MSKGVYIPVPLGTRITHISEECGCVVAEYEAVDIQRLYKQVEDIQEELEEVEAMSEQEVRKKYNADSKKSILRTIEKELQQAQIELDEAKGVVDDGMDYELLCRCQGLSF